MEASGYRTCLWHWFSPYGNDSRAEELPRHLGSWFTSRARPETGMGIQLVCITLEQRSYQDKIVAECCHLWPRWPSASHRGKASLGFPYK